MPTAYKALNPNFIVKISKQQLIDNREGDKVYHHQSYIWYSRNLQCGEVVDISPSAKKEMPTVEIGDTLIFHHFIEASASQSEMTSSYIVDETDTDFYFNVSSRETYGEINQTYGVLKSGIIIPHKDYTFLEIAQPIAKMEFEMTREDKLKKLDDVKNLNLYLMNNSAPNEELQTEVRRAERRNFNITKELNNKETLAYSVAFASKEKPYKKGDTIWAFNMAANTTVSINNNEYRVIESKYIRAIY
jgi:co-chaperonin GroES (HSP10)